MKSLLNALRRFDIIYTYYGTKFDVPFVRTRALRWNLPFPFFQQIYHNDLYYSVRNKTKIVSNRLESITKFLGIEGKTKLEHEYWIRAMYGEAKALKYIREHNIKDVEILEKLHERLRPYIQMTRRSI